MGVVEPRYARALYALTARAGAEEVKRSADSLDALAGYLEENESVSRFMRNPLVPFGAIRDAALGLLPPNAPESVKSLIGVMADRKRLSLLPGVAAAYRRLLTEKSELVYVYITSAYPLEEGQYERMGEIFARRQGAKAYKVIPGADASLLGGVRVQVGDTVADGTLKMKLERFKELMR